MMSKLSAAVLGVVLVAVVVLGVKTMVYNVKAGGQVRTEKLPAPVLDEAKSAAHSETAVFAGGCFWGVQLFQDNGKLFED